MKHIVFTALLEISAVGLAGQITVDGSGSVGIGTTTPSYGLLNVYQSASRTNAAIFEVNNADTVVGFDYGVYLRNRDATVGNFASLVNWDANFNGNAWIQFINVDHSTPKGAIAFVTRNGGSYSRRLYINEDGDVGIGSSSPSHKLQVTGTVRAISFISDTTTYADFVFDADYNLPTLSEVEDHIEQHGHLPGIPSELEVMEHGIDLADMQVALLQKIEELTLHVIELDKRNRRLEAMLEH